MIKRLKIALWFSLFICASCAISKKENERMDKLLSQQNKVMEIPHADSITAEMLRKFEMRASQKLEDFYDYLELLGNVEYSESMKDEIKISAHGLFYHSNSWVLLLDRSTEEPRTVEDALIFYEEISSGEPLSVSEIEIWKPLSKTGKELFTGEMTFLLTIGKDEALKSMEKKADFSLRKIEKNLGHEQVAIWEVFLEEIH